MKKPVRIGLYVLGGVAGLVLVLVLAALIVVQTAWFRNLVRERMIAEVENSTGGRVEIGAFEFDWSGLRAVVRDFVIHGKEGPSEPPFFRARSIEVVLKIVSAFKRDVDIHSLTVEQPQVYVRVAQDGSTNLPEPKVKREPRKDPIQTVVDLAIRRFEIRDGLIQFAHRRMPLEARGENLSAHLNYELAGPRYTGNLKIQPVYVRQGNRPALPVATDIDVQIQQGRIDIARGEFRTPQSHLNLAGNLSDFSLPKADVRLKGSVSAAEIASALGGAQSAGLRQAPPVGLNASASLNGTRLNIAGVQVDLGRSSLEASGVITDVKTVNGALRFDGTLVLGELGRILNVSARPEGTVRIGGDATLAGARNYTVLGNVTATGMALNAGARRLENVRAQSRLELVPDLISLKNLQLSALGGQFGGNATLRSFDRLRLAGNLRGFELRQLAQEYAGRNLVWNGLISGPLDVSASLKGPIAKSLVANARLGIAPGSQGVPVSGLVDVNYDGPRDTINLNRSYIQLPSTRADFSGTLGQQLRIRLASRNLNDLLPALALALKNPPREMPVTLQSGTAVFDGTVGGRLADPKIDGRLDVGRFTVRGEGFDRLHAIVAATKGGASVRDAVVTRGKLEARVEAAVGLRNWKPEPDQPVQANAGIRNATLRDVLALAGREQMQLSGNLQADAKVSGTVGDPRIGADLNITEGAAYGEPFQRLVARVNTTQTAVNLESQLLAARTGRVNLNASYRHPVGRFDNGSLAFRVDSAGVRLENVRNIQMRQPGLEGTVDLNAKGEAAIDLRKGANRVLFSHLDAKLDARAIEVRTKRAGNLTAAAETRGQNLVVDFRSDLANSDIRGRATWLLAGDYPVNAELSFSPVRIAAVRNLIAPPRPGQAQIDGVVEGHATVSGPSTKPAQLRGFLTLARVELTAPAIDRPGARQAFALRNAAPVRLALERSTIRIDRARFTGPATDLSLGGAVYLDRADMFDLAVDGSLGLELVQRFNPSIFGSGAVALKASVRGNTSQPSVDGRLELRDASFNHVEMPAGVSNANGVIRFNGRQATIESFEGETGGGKIGLAGFVRYAGKESVFNLQANAKGVRVRYPPHASTRVNAELALNGTAADSLLSGTVTITETAFYSQSDFGSFLSEAGTPPRTPAARTGILANMRLDVRVRTAPAAEFHTTLAQNLDADVNLQLRGTPAEPGLVGRVVITQGQIKFFGATYDIGRATISFFNPSRIEPVLNVDLETKVRAVQVFLSVNGPIDRMRLSYRSDPPLPFSDIVGLLATGKVPTTDPVLAAQQPPAPEQSLQQLGASTVLGQAVANPVAGRLQRLFGVTRLKIDPQITGAENNPQARMTMEQQITRDLTFTYIQDLTQSNTQVVRVEWAVNPNWSAVAVRQENGQFGLDLYYKKRLW